MRSFTNRHQRRAMLYTMMIVVNIIIVIELRDEMPEKKTINNKKRENLVIYSSIDCLAASHCLRASFDILPNLIGLTFFVVAVRNEQAED
jgi:hypothetical protein